jgi:hypothetical protein
MELNNTSKIALIILAVISGQLHCGGEDKSADLVAQKAAEIVIAKMQPPFWHNFFTIKCVLGCAGVAGTVYVLTKFATPNDLNTLNREIKASATNAKDNLVNSFNQNVDKINTDLNSTKKEMSDLDEKAENLGTMITSEVQERTKKIAIVGDEVWGFQNRLVGAMDKQHTERVFVFNAITKSLEKNREKTVASQGQVRYAFYVFAQSFNENRKEIETNLDKGLKNTLQKQKDSYQNQQTKFAAVNKKIENLESDLDLTLQVMSQTAEILKTLSPKDLGIEGEVNKLLDDDNKIKLKIIEHAGRLETIEDATKKVHLKKNNKPFGAPKQPSFAVVTQLSKYHKKS